MMKSIRRSQKGSKEEEVDSKEGGEVLTRRSQEDSGHPASQHRLYQQHPICTIHLSASHHQTTSVINKNYHKSCNQTYIEGPKKVSQSARLSVGVQLLFGQCPNERGIIYNGASFSQIDRVTKKITQNENGARVAEKQPFLSFAKK